MFNVSLFLGTSYMFRLPFASVGILYSFHNVLDDSRNMYGVPGFCPRISQDFPGVLFMPGKKQLHYHNTFIPRFAGKKTMKGSWHTRTATTPRTRASSSSSSDLMMRHTKQRVENTRFHLFIILRFCPECGGKRFLSSRAIKHNLLMPPCQLS
jgi:hypothetical protein